MSAKLFLCTLCMLLSAYLALASSYQPTARQFSCVFPTVPNNKVDAWINPMKNAFDYADIDDKSQVAAFWALSGVLTLQYETFKEVGTSKCVNYDGGCDYTGRGALMLRGSGTYREAALALLRNYGSNPESVLEPSEAFLSAAWLWKKKRDIDDFGSQIGVAELLLAANRFGINSATDLALLGTIYARSLLCLANDTTCAWYVVSQGDTPQLIAAALNVNIDTLVALNNWSGPNQALTPGESIKIYCTST